MRGGAEVCVSHVAKRFEGGRILALDDVSLTVDAGELVALVGPSGSGKSTLLNLIGALDRPDAGAIRVDGREPFVDASAYRASTVGFVFQFHHLIPTLSALENVELPMLGNGLPRRGRVERARRLLEEVGLSQRAGGRPPTLSGGERQRVAIARALANEPRLLLADEPTGALDSETGAQILEVLRRARRERGTTIVIATNDAGVAASSDRALRLLDGRLASAD